MIEEPKNFEDESLEFIKALPLTPQQLDSLYRVIEWEKELSWCDGYADGVEVEEKTPKTSENLFGSLN